MVDHLQHRSPSSRAATRKRVVASCGPRGVTRLRWCRRSEASARTRTRRV